MTCSTTSHYKVILFVLVSEVYIKYTFVFLYIHIDTENYNINIFSVFYAFFSLS